MAWLQREIRLQPHGRGFHLITQEVMDQMPELNEFRVGLAHIFIKHTSASLVLNENAEPEVRTDMEAFFSRLAPENEPYYTHNYEGPDDMPAHLKSVLIGSSVTVPIRDGQLNLGAWQGIYLCEHRESGHRRRLVITLHGE
jgi:secondary thiamine-phosphate synthase enzyme